MNAPLEIVNAEPLVPAIIEVEKHPEHLLIGWPPGSDEKLRARFLAEIRSEIASAIPDLSTVKGRDEIRSRAAKINRSKAPINKAAITLKNGIDAARKAIIAELETLETDARNPLTEWEEEKYIWTDFATIGEGWTSDLALGRMEAAQEKAAHPSLFAEKEKAIAALSAAYIRIKEAEEEKEELERLRAEEAKRLAEQLALASELEAKAAYDDEVYEPCAVAWDRAPELKDRRRDPAPNATPSPAAITKQDPVRAKLTEAKLDIMRAVATSGGEIPEAYARIIVLAIKAGKVRNVSMHI